MIALILIQTVLFLILVVQFMRESDERQNINSICYHLTDTVEGCDLQVPLSLSLESVRLLAGLKASEFNVKINSQLKIVLFEYESEYTKISFIVSGLVK